MDSELIQVKDVTKKFKKNLVLDNISFSIPEGQITGIVGASGEGKSTILKLLIGFYKPNKGRIFFLRRDILKDFKNVKNIFGFATEDGSFYEDLNVRENILHFGRLYKIKNSELKSRLKEVINLVELNKAERTRARYLSVGMKKRLDIACAIIHDPQILILDEPTADLDPLLRDEILDLIIKIKREGKTIILTTQLLEEMDIVCDKVAILHDKKIVEEGTPDYIKSKYKCGNLSDVFDIIFSGIKLKDKIKEKKKNEEKNKLKQKEKGNSDSFANEVEKEFKEIEKKDKFENNKAKINNGIEDQIEKILYKSENPKIEDFGKVKRGE